MTDKETSNERKSFPCLPAFSSDHFLLYQPRDIALALSLSFSLFIHFLRDRAIASRIFKTSKLVKSTDIFLS